LSKERSVSLFEELAKSELWFGLLPELLNIEQKWIALNGITLEKHLSITQRPYMANATRNRQGGFACQVLRSILERTAFLWATSDELGQDPEEITAAYSSNNRKQRRQITDLLIDSAKTKDSEINILYDVILSRYYNHLSHLDSLSISPENPMNHVFRHFIPSHRFTLIRFTLFRAIQYEIE